MLNFEIENILTVGPILLSIIAIIISCLGWNKSRVIYGVETEIYDPEDVNSVDYINKKLSSGKYIVLNSIEKPYKDVSQSAGSSVLQPGSILMFSQGDRKVILLILGKIHL